MFSMMLAGNYIYKVLMKRHAIKYSTYAYILVHLSSRFTNENKYTSFIRTVLEYGDICPGRICIRRNSNDIS